MPGKKKKKRKKPAFLIFFLDLDGVTNGCIVTGLSFFIIINMSV
jgi:hypothetical protein